MLVALWCWHGFEDADAEHGLYREWALSDLESEGDNVAGPVDVEGLVRGRSLCCVGLNEVGSSHEGRPKERDRSNTTCWDTLMVSISPHGEEAVFVQWEEALQTHQS